MPILSTITTRRLLPAFAALIGGPLFLVSCSDSGVDSDTARYVVGEGRDTTSTLPDLQKAYIEAGIVGEGGNLLASDFVNFSRVTQYGVDTLPDGRVKGLRDVHLSASFGDPDDASARHNFYPLRELQFRIAGLSAGGQGTNGGVPAELEDDPDQRSGTGLKALFAHMGTAVTLVTRPGDPKSRGYAYISGVDPAKRTIGLHVEADLTNPIAPGTPNRVVDRLVVRIDLQLPY